MKDSTPFAAKLNLLFQASAYLHPDRPGERVEYTNKQVADKIAEDEGKGKITAAYIGMLRREDGPNPSLEKAGLLARFFKVPLDYFTDGPTADAVLEELRRLVASRAAESAPAPAGDDEQISLLARSARRLSPDSLRLSLEFVQRLGDLEEKAPDRP
ncbi:hypothetical protein [Streptomyces sclerotialus]|uniref:hypothetical protein n=1 Tax=Streptomyces sclerotialus TaxID=1957 RepID=UPI000691829A